MQLFSLKRRFAKQKPGKSYKYAHNFQYSKLFLKNYV